jgi:manganese transport protein
VSPKKILELSLGVMTAMGGFVDVGELLFTTRAGARFSHAILWIVPLSTVGIIAYSEMCGRIAAVTRQPVFAIVRSRLGPAAGLVTLVASLVLNVVTCAAEIGGIALLLKLLLGGSHVLLAIPAAIALILITWTLSFEWIERLFGLGGLLMIAFLVAVVLLHPDWGRVARGLVPQVPSLKPGDGPLYAYFVVGLTSSILMPYEVYFYSSGAVEERWTASDIKLNRVVSIAGMSLGSLLAAALVVIGATLFHERGIDPALLGSPALAPLGTLGRAGLLAAILGMLFAIGGSAVETALSAAYSACQFAGWEWGRSRRARDTPVFSIGWVAAFAIGLAIVLTGLDPLKIVEAAVLLSIVVLPLTYLPILLVARDEDAMGEHVNGTLANVLGWGYLGVVVACAVTAVPLYFMEGSR